jgi:hypothetical protein
MKYICFETTLGGEKQKIPIIFPKQLVHAMVAEAMIPCFAAHGLGILLPVSAGEVTIFGTEITCHGKSETLKLHADPRDAATIHNHDYCFGLDMPEQNAAVSILRKLMKEKRK